LRTDANQGFCPWVSAADRARSEAIVADRNRARKHVARARIVPGSADRLSVAEGARRARVVRRWQRQFAEAGIDRPRHGHSDVHHPPMVLEVSARERRSAGCRSTCPGLNFWVEPD
jgi:hypothetical protein